MASSADSDAIEKNYGENPQVAGQWCCGGSDDRLAMKNLAISWPWPFAKDFSDSLALVCPQPRDLPGF